jgi:hypothetical protein
VVEPTRFASLRVYPKFANSAFKPLEIEQMRDSLYRIGKSYDGKTLSRATLYAL